MSTTKQEVEMAECSYESIISAFKGTSWEKLAVPLDELYSNAHKANASENENLLGNELDTENDNEYENTFGMH